MDGQGLPNFESLYGNGNGAYRASDAGMMRDMGEINMNEEEVAEVDAHLRPRVIGLPPDEWYRERSERQMEGMAQAQQTVRLDEGGGLPGYGEAVLSR